MADKIDEILDRFEADLNVETAYTPKVLAKAEILKAVDEAVVAELKKLEQYLDLPHHQIAKKAVADRIKQITKENGEE